MKNWIIALAVLLIPMLTYFVLDKTNSDKAAFEALAKPSYTKPVVIKFASPMCLDCKKLESVMNEVMPKYAGKIDYQKINAQSNDAETRKMIKKYSVTLVPTMVFLKKDGSMYDRTEGYMSKSQLEKILNGLLK